ncbi:PEP-CTERM system histidine kinase PrsK [Pseudoduganella sp. LjRoot289]|uniref:XrtA/PEP-CTERM system histidine kinase PrsK n=1 Tax=Pseudoduganella sp. LjRoot289 TaxID=3342314 RepID=UPI003ECE3419
MAGGPQLSASFAAGASHALLALAYLGLSLLLLRGWRQGRHATALLVACGLTGLWAAAVVVAAYAGSAGLPAGGGLPGAPAPVRPDVVHGALAQAAEVLEAARTVGWLLFLLSLLGRAGQRRNWLLAAAVFLAVLPLAYDELAGALEQGLAVYTTEPAGATVRDAVPAAAAAGTDAAALSGATAGLRTPDAILPIICRLMLAVAGLLLLEQLYRGTAAHERWGVKYACLGIGVLFAYDFYLYSDALLFRRMNPDLWAARGLVGALGAPLLAIAAARKPRWTLGLALSRQMLFRSAALMGSALYLLAMAGSAWYLRSFGGDWGPLMQAVWLAGAAIVLAGVLFSGAVRAYAKVFISKHFYQSRFDYRDEWQRFTRTLSLEGPDLGLRAVQALAALVESPAGALWLRRDGDGGSRCVPAASWNLAPQHGTASAEFCLFMEDRQWVLDVPECLARPERYAGLELPLWLHGVPQLWLVVPLVLQGRLYGLVALTQPRTPLELDWEVRDLLKIAGSQAASYLAHQESSDALAVARQFESLNRMSAFIVHDLKNLVSQLSLLLSNAERHKGNPEFQRDMLETLAHSVRKMTLLLQKLSRGEAPERKLPLPLAQVLEQAVQARAAARPRPQLEVRDNSLLVLADWHRLERVLGHLILNAVEATPPDGKVALLLRREGDSAVVELSDTGAGMSEQFIRERLFKPFDTTKTAGMGIGVFESREYLGAIGGRLEVASERGVGTTFRVTLPLHAAAAAAA